MNLRRAAFPFDWCLTPASAINTLFGRDFFNWPSSRNLIACESDERILVQDEMDLLEYTGFDVNNGREVKSSLVQHGEVVRPVISEESGILFPHEPFIESQDKSINAFVSKYQRRVHRMRKAITSGGIVGIRDDSIEPNEFQISYLDRYLGNGASIDLFGPSAESIDSALVEEVLDSVIEFDKLAKQC